MPQPPAPLADATTAPQLPTSPEARDGRVQLVVISMGGPRKHAMLSCYERRFDFWDVKVARKAFGDATPDARFRISVTGGGCSGFQYGFSFDADLNADDRVFERYGVEVVVDEISLDLLGGAVVDWKEDLAGAMFVVENPNAASSCGCGSSFAI